MKTKALISFAVTAKLICAFVFANADCWFSHAVVHFKNNLPVNKDQDLEQVKCLKLLNVFVLLLFHNLLKTVCVTVCSFHCTCMYVTFLLSSGVRRKHTSRSRYFTNSRCGSACVTF